MSLQKILSPEVASNLLCDMCSELLSIPITLCAKGHAICGSCRQHNKMCHVCNGSFTNARNFAAEGLLARGAFKCKYRSNGCENFIRGIQFRNHVITCTFRPVYCNLNPCLANPVSVQLYAEHLLNYHGVPGEMVEASICDIAVAQEWRSILKEQMRSSGPVPSYYIQFDSELFLLHTFVKENLVYWWVSLVNYKPEAGDRFRCIISLKSPYGVHKIKWAGLVYGADERFSSLQKEIISVLPFNTLKNVFSKAEANESVHVGSMVSTSDLNSDDFGWEIVVYLEKVKL